MVNYRKAQFLVTIVFILIFNCISNSLFAGGPWVQKKGQSYFKLSEWILVFDEHFTGSGLTDPNITTGIFNTFLYAEYGLNDRLTGILNGALFSRNYMNNVISNATNQTIINGEALNAIGDFDIGLKYGLTKPEAKIPVAVSLIFGLPFGKTGEGALGALQTGDGEFNQTLQLDFGKGFKISESPAYLSAFTAFNNRTKGFSDEFRYGLEFGVGLFSEALWLSTKLNGLNSLKNGETVETVTSTSIFANNAEFTTVSVEANYQVNEKFGLSASFTNPITGKIFAAAPAYSFGIYF